MAGVDGSVIVDAKMDLKGFDDNVKQMSSKMLKLNNSIQQTEEEISKIKNQMKELADSEVPTAEYDQLTRKVKNAENSFNSLISKREILEESGKTTGDSEWENVNRQIERALLNLQSYEKERDALENKSIKGIETEQYKKLVTQLNKASDKYKVLNRQREEATTKENKIANAINRVKKASEKKFASMFGGSDKASNSIERLTKRILNILGSVFVFTVLNKAFTSLRTYMGDALATNDQFNASLAQIKSNLATAFYPVYQAALPAINALMSALAQITGTIATFIAMMFGTTVEKAQAGASAMQAQADAMSNTGDAAKKAKKQLAGFDDAQILSKNEESSNGGSGTGSTTQTTDIQTNVNVGKWVQQLKDAWASADFTSVGYIIGAKFSAALDGINWESIKSKVNHIAKSIATLFNGFLEGTDWKLVGGTIAEGINTAFGFVYTFATTFDWSNLGSSIANTINGFLQRTNWILLAQTISESLKGVLSTVLTLITTIDWGQVGKSIVEFITNIDWLALAAGLGTALLALIVAAFDLLFGAVGELCSNVAEFFEEIGLQGIAGFFKGIADNLAASVRWIKDKFNTYILKPIKDFFGIHSPSTVFAELGGFLIKGLINGIEKMITSIPKIFFDIFSDGWAKVQQVFSISNITSFFGGIVTRIKNLFTNVGSAISSAVGKTFSSGINAVLGTIESIVNGFINKINSVIGFIDKVTPGSIGRLSTISLPRLASGTVVPANYGEFLAVLGDNKKETEVVSPLSTMKKAFVEALNEMGDTGSKDIHLTVNIDGQAVYKTVVKYNNRNTKITGKNALAQ